MANSRFFAHALGSRAPQAIKGRAALGGLGAAWALGKSLLRLRRASRQAIEWAEFLSRLIPGPDEPPNVEDALWGAAMPSASEGSGPSGWAWSAGLMRSHKYSLGSTGQGKSGILSVFESFRKGGARLFLKEGVSNADSLLWVKPWALGSDESLDGSHPCVALCFFKRFSEAERLGPAEVEKQADLLARILAGERELLDGLDPQWLRGLDASTFARVEFPSVLARAAELAPSLMERRAIATALAHPPNGRMQTGNAKGIRL